MQFNSPPDASCTTGPNSSERAESTARSMFQHDARCVAVTPHSAEPKANVVANELTVTGIVPVKSFDRNSSDVVPTSRATMACEDADQTATVVSIARTAR